LVLTLLVPALAAAQTWEVTGEEAKLRLTPDEYATTIAVVPGGTQLKQLDKFSYWVKVQYKDHIGWITQYNLLPAQQNPQPPVEIRRADFSPITRRQCFVVTNQGTMPFRGFIYIDGYDLTGNRSLSEKFPLSLERHASRELCVEVRGPNLPVEYQYGYGEQRDVRTDHPHGGESLGITGGSAAPYRR
jgi:hypothetical protein